MIKTLLFILVFFINATAVFPDSATKKADGQTEILVYDSGNIIEFPYSSTVIFNSAAWSALNLPEGNEFQLRKVITMDYIGTQEGDYLQVNVTTQSGTCVYKETVKPVYIPPQYTTWVIDNVLIDVSEQFGVGSSIVTTLDNDNNDEWLDMEVRIKYYYVDTR